MNMLAALTPDVRNAWCSTKQNSLYNRGGFLHNAEVRATIARAQLPLATITVARVHFFCVLTRYCGEKCNVPNRRIYYDLLVP